jgi:hypothetical protein
MIAAHGLASRGCAPYRAMLVPVLGHLHVETTVTVGQSEQTLRSGGEINGSTVRLRHSRWVRTRPPASKARLLEEGAPTAEAEMAHTMFEPS